MKRAPAILLLFFSGCVHARVDAVTVKQELFEADRAFARATEERGLEGWMSFFADDAVRFSMGSEVHRGEAAIRAFDGPMFENPAIKLRWDPEVGGGLGSDHGFTRGRYQVVRVDEEGSETTLSSGTYLSFWRRERGGAWKVVLDTGAPDEKK